MFASRQIRPCLIGNPLFTCPLRSRSDLHRFDHASELRKMMSPPAIRVRDSTAIHRRPRPRTVAPPSPVAIKRVDAVGHLNSRMDKRGSGKPIFCIKIYDDVPD
jgi:hypothetical protein